MTETGELVQWDDERGFGFIEARGGKRFFVHVTSIARMINRPRIGDVVTFDPTLGKDGRPVARSVLVSGANPVGFDHVRQRRAKAKAQWDWRLLLAGLLAVLATFVALVGNAPVYLPLVYLGLGVLSLSLYRTDKSAAETGQWRISEAMLLGVDLVGGIIGGLIAQAIFRHKTRKPSYVAATIALASIHLLWLACLASGIITVADLASALMHVGGG